MDSREYEFFKTLGPPVPAFHASEAEKLLEEGETILYGYDLDRLTVHIYWEDGTFNVFRYRSSDHFLEGSRKQVQTLLQEHLPTKRAYPENTSLPVARLLLNRGFSVSYTTHREKVFTPLRFQPEFSL